MDEVLVDGDEGYKAAKDFMKSLTPSHARKVQQYKDTNVPLFQRYQVESQLDAMHSNTVQLRSGGYLVFNQTEALVAVDVNRSEEHTSELQSLMRISYAVFCLKKKKQDNNTTAVNKISKLSVIQQYTHVKHM